MPLIYAQTQDMVLYKDSYYPKESFQAEIFYSNIKATDISVLNSLGYQTTIGISLIKITNNHYFVYFDVPQLDPGIYTLKVKELQKQFEIKPKQNNVLLIFPGGIKFTPADSPFSKVTVTNQNTIAETVSISSPSSLVKPSLNSLIIPAKSSKFFYITIDKSQQNNFLAALSINDYKLPVWFVIKEETESLNVMEEQKEQREEGLQFYIRSNGQDIYLNYITKEIESSTQITGSVYFKNVLNESLKNIRISLAGNLQEIVSLEFTDIGILNSNEEKELGIIINENRLPLSGSYSGNLVISTDKYVFKLPMNFIVVESAEEPESLTLEETVKTEESTELVNKTEVQEEKPKMQFKWLYLLVLIILFIVIAFVLSKKPKLKKQSFKEFISKLKQ